MSLTIVDKISHVCQINTFYRQMKYESWQIDGKKQTRLLLQQCRLFILKKTKKKTTIYRKQNIFIQQTLSQQLAHSRTVVKAQNKSLLNKQRR